MNGKQYNNIINWTLNHDSNVSDTDSLDAVRTICNNMGVSLPNGNINEVAEVLATNDYMYWRSCEPEEAQEMANNGVATVSISDSKISMLTAIDEEDHVSDNSTGSTYNNNINVINDLENSSISYYAYSGGSTNSSSQDFANGTYYINNRRYGKYMKNLTSKIGGVSGRLMDLGSSIYWRIVYKNGGYVIQMVGDTTKFLGVDTNKTLFNVVLVTASASSIPDRCKWDFSYSTNGVQIKSTYNNRYLTFDGNIVTTTNSVGDPGANASTSAAWRIISTTDYGNSEYYDYQELENGFSFKDMFVNIDSTMSPTYNKTSTNYLWTNPYDFEYSIISGNNNSITINLVTGKITGKKADILICQAKHKPTNYTCTFKIYVDRYMFELVNTFGFSEDNAKLIRSMYDKIDVLFQTDSIFKKAWRYSRSLGGIIYDHDNLKELFKVVAGTIWTDSEENYFTNILGLTTSEYTTLKNAIRGQHNNTNTPDFAHMHIALSARLAYYLDLDSNIGPDIIDIAEVLLDEDISYLAGWLGDTVIYEANGTTSIKNDDYCADLDAENIYKLITNGHTLINSINTYYTSLSSRSTRAIKFCENIDYDTVKSKVFYYLVDFQLLIFMNSASQSGDFATVIYYNNLLNNEQYHMNTIKTNYPDTYNFLCSLRDGLSTIAIYE